MSTQTKTPMRYTYLTSCPQGLEKDLAKEIAPYNVRKTHLLDQGVEFQTESLKALEMLTSLKLASRLYLLLKRQTLNDIKDLYNLSFDYDWDKHLQVYHTFKIKVILQRDVPRDFPAFKNSLYCSQLIKDGICDFFNRRFGKRPSVELKNPDFIIKAYIKRIDSNQRYPLLGVDLWLDLAGAPLSKRNLRSKNFAYSLKENLASCLLQQIKWDAQKDILVDGMCGSGTFLTEGLILKHQLPASIFSIVAHFEQNRPLPWSFLKANWYQKNLSLQELFKQFIQKQYQNYLELLNSPEFRKTSFWGIEKNPEHLSLARSNLKLLKLFSKGRLYLGDLLSARTAEQVNKAIFSTAEKSATMILNPPYGIRFQSDPDLTRLYQAMNLELKKLYPKFKIYIFCSKEMAKLLPEAKMLPTLFHNGPITCALLQIS